MEYRTYDASVCVMTKIFAMIGGKWKPIILYLIKNDINRFGLLKRSMPKISKKILTEQLRELEQDKLITREVISATYPQVIEYRLTESGTSLRVLIDQMLDWGVNHFRNEYTEEMMREFQNKKSVLEVSVS
ncbi:helix-turn-helix transcriptional regulator [Fulvivirgaceae bacterium PWU4]|uniref:Helix-turn-helix transcriptional regulator n=1 Tax=Chryseosolibacter histidini TaxID=2782349 RepID=A0AAP2DMY6_9BACT|nr:helix-turn-helix domain-containing protein [Chryseosolibacter histidini]MBT1699251.1 helix-turn-helix transcriptional regulator [Chryseosolibacter histidini]